MVDGEAGQNVPRLVHLQKWYAGHAALHRPAAILMRMLRNQLFQLGYSGSCTLTVGKVDTSKGWQRTC